MVDKQQKFHDVMESFDTAMLITATEGGAIRGRPMAIAEVASNDSLWFVTNETSAKVDEIESDWQVCVTMQDGKRFLSLSGTAVIRHDPSKTKDLWRPTWKIWFPKGPEDPDLSLLHVTPTTGEYWDNSGTEGWKYLYEAGKSYFSGTRPEIGKDVHAKVNL